MKILEKLHALALGQQTSDIVVTSTGCTRSEHFKVEINEQIQPGTIAVYRLKPDYCRRAPMPLKLTLKLEVPIDTTRDWVIMNETKAQALQR